VMMISLDNKQIVKNYKFSIYSYNMLQEFAVDNEVIVTSHSQIVRKSHVWRTGSPRVLEKLAQVPLEF